MPDWPGLRDDDVHRSLVRRPGALPVRSVESDAVSTRTVAFSGRVHTWEEMPDESIRVAWSDAPLVAEGDQLQVRVLVDDPGAYARSSRVHPLTDG